MPPTARQEWLGRWAPFTRAGRAARDYRTIAASGLFDPDWYRDFAPELDERADPLLHFLRQGAAELRDPGPGFSLRGYLAAHPGRVKPGTNPLLHFLRHGRGLAPVPALAPPDPAEGDADKGVPDPALPGDARWLAPPPAAPRRVAVVAHVYYPVLWPAMARYIANMPVPFDLYATVPAPAGRQLVAAIRARFPGAAILASANRGRDLRPFLMILRRLLAARCETVCKVHSKHSPHRNDGSAWRREMFRALLDTPATAQRILDAFAADGRLGLVAPVGHLLPLDGYCGEAGNADGVRWLADRARLGPLPRDAKFAGGSMFWLRPAALASALAHAFEPEAFAPEDGAIDATLAHAWERFTGIAVSAAGYRLADTAALGLAAGADAAARRTARYGAPKRLSPAMDALLFSPAFVHAG